MRESEPKKAAAPLLSRARVPLLATLAIVVSVVAIWQGVKRGGPPPAVEPESRAPVPPDPGPQEAHEPASEARAAAEQQALRQFIDGLERMLDAPARTGAQPTGAAKTRPLPVPEHLKDAPRNQQLGYYRELLEHGEGMIELNRAQMPKSEVAEAEAVLDRVRERLEVVGDAG